MCFRLSDSPGEADLCAYYMHSSFHYSVVKSVGLTISSYSRNVVATQICLYNIHFTIYVFMQICIGGILRDSVFFNYKRLGK